MRGSKIDGDAFLLPIAIARGVELLRLAIRPLNLLARFGLWHRRRFAEVSGRIEMFGAFHDANMVAGALHAKR